MSQLPGCGRRNMLALPCVRGGALRLEVGEEGLVVSARWGVCSG